MVFRMIGVSAAIAALSACGGASTSSNGGESAGFFDAIEENTVVSDGILLDVVLPDAATRATRTATLRRTVNAFEVLNENFDATTDLPSSGTVGTTYSGNLTFAIGADEGFETVDGDVVITADANAMTFNGTLSNLSLEQTDGSIVALGGEIPIETTIRNDEAITFDGTMFGNVTNDGDTAVFAGLLDGAFVGENGSDVIGQVSGDVISDGERIAIRGLMTAEN
ncbi:hypothetical protein [Yoonia sp. 208BN28-4]|uniref:hypothetical protein n=1 Tax=Yoonia sp. 208BN28-4 TaxID=3126505 RepID=UPI0030A0151C